MNFKSKALDASEAQIVAALIEAIQSKYLLNIAQGSTPDNAWPNANPFTLLEQRPPYREGPYYTTNIPDNVHWRIYNDTGMNPQFLISCPHWNGDYASQYGTKGNFYVYVYGTGGWYYQGAFYLAGYCNKGH